MRLPRPSPMALAVAVFAVAAVVYMTSRGLDTFLSFTVVGIAFGSAYALAAMGVVVTYTTSGIFNFAHGGLGMLLAFAYWDLSINHDWPDAVALVVVLFVIAPLVGAIVERLLMRHLHGAPTGVSVTVTTALLLVTLGLGVELWDQSQARALPQFFGDSDVAVFGINISYHQIVSVVVAIGVAVSLRFFFYGTRLGIAMRAVVDDPELASLNGAAPARVAQASWMLGTALAALSFILIAPVGRLEVIALTLGVLNAFAATVVGKLRSLPMTFAGAIGLGLLISYGVGYLADVPGGEQLQRIQPALPTIFLFVALLAAPQARLRAGRLVTARAPRVPTLRESAVGGAALVAFTVVITGIVSESDQIAVGRGLALMFVMLSLVLLTGWGGQTSLCQLTFVGVGAFTFAQVASTGNLLGVIPAIVAGALVGCVVAAIAVRLQGLYLALATLAFAQGMDFVFFQDPNVFGFGGRLAVPRLRLLGLELTTERSYIVLTAIVVALAAIGVLAIKRGPFGRRLAAMSDSPAACATLGLNQTTTKLIVFALSAGLAGLAGVFYGGLKTGVAPGDFEMLQSLVLLLLVTVGGVTTVTGAFIGGFVFTMIPVLQENIDALSGIQGLQYLAVGVGAMTLGRKPNGIAGDIAAAGEAVRARFRKGTPEAPARLETTEVEGLVRA